MLIIMKTGMSSSSSSRLSISKQSGVLISSRLILRMLERLLALQRLLPQPHQRQFNVEDIDIREALKEICFPSITGLPAKGPMLPRPSDSSAIGNNSDKVSLEVYSNAADGFKIAKQGSATPGVYASERSR